MSMASAISWVDPLSSTKQCRGPRAQVDRSPQAPPIVLSSSRRSSLTDLFRVLATLEMGGNCLSRPGWEFSV